MCYEDENNCNSVGTKHNSLSLNELLKNNFEVDYNIKDEVHEMMSNYPYLWKTRPIPYKLNYYAGCDVLYLPKLYDLFVKKCETKVVKKINISDIFKECEKYLQYLKMNKNIKNYNKMNLTKGTKIKGLIKNFQHHCVYVQLNIGYIGYVDIFSSVQLLKDKHKLGDIVDFTILDIENKRKRMLLDISEKEKENENKENIEDEKKNEINTKNNINDFFNNNYNNKANKIDTVSLVHELNINKEGFYPKSYIQNLKNGYNYNNYMNNFHNNINDYYYYKENAIKKNNQINNYLYLNNEMLNNNHNELIYNDKENYYYYEQNDKNEESEDANSNKFYYTLKPFPK